MEPLLKPFISTEIRATHLAVEKGFDHLPERVRMQHELYHLGCCKPSMTEVGK